MKNIIRHYIIHNNEEKPTKKKKKLVNKKMQMQFLERKMNKIEE